jgi:hypothetical protein
MGGIRTLIKGRRVIFSGSLKTSAVLEAETNLHQTPNLFAS